MSRSLGAQYDLDTFNFMDNLKALVEKAQIQSGEYVLDLGCGTGTLAIMASRYTSGQVCGIDINPEQVAYARSKIQEADRQRICFIEGNVVNMMAGDRKIIIPDTTIKFNVVFICRLIHNIGHEDTQSMFRAIRPYLTPDVRIVIETTYSRSRSERLSAGALIYDLVNQQNIASLQWIDERQRQDCIAELEEVAAAMGLQSCGKTEVAMGDGQYLPARERLPPFIQENIDTIRKLVGKSPEVPIPPTQADRKQQIQHLKQFVDMRNKIQSGRYASVGEYVQHHLEPTHQDVRDPNMVSGKKWHEDVLPMYRNIVNLIRQVRGGQPDWTIRTEFCVMAYQASGVFKYTELF